MRCEQIRELLSPYIDQMTDKKENNAIIAHLAACPHCREELKQLEAMTGMMHHLYTPVLPDSFNHDLRQRINDEKITILKTRDLKTPSKAGWIAAAVALVALGTGIFTSNYLPVDNMIVYHDQQAEQITDKPSMSVEDILNRLNIWDNDKTDSVSEGMVEPGQEPVEPGKGNMAPPSEEQPAPETQAPPAESEPVVKIADIYSAQVKVDNTEEAVGKIVQIAQANQAAYDVNASSSMVQAFSAGSSKMVELKVAPEKVDGIIKELESMGMFAAPMHDQAELTDEYNEALEQIEAINEKIAAADARQDEAQLNELNKELYNWTSRQNVIDEEINQATIRVFLIEEIKP